MRNDYSAYSIEDFVSDESFIAWVIQGENSMIWEKWLKENPERESDVRDAAALVKSMGEHSWVLNREEKSKLWGRISQSSGKKSGIRSLYITSAIAASFVLIFYFTGLWPGNSQIEIVNQTQKFSEYVLPDQSVVALAPGTKIAFIKDGFIEERIVNMSGKAFFEVTKGSSFWVHCDKGSVQVLGTSFDVETTGSDFMVKCYSGKVNVYSDKKQVMLISGEQTSFASKTSLKKSFNIIAYPQPDWMVSSIKFENASLHEVIIQLEKMYNINIETADSLIKGKKHTGILSDNDLEKALVSITWPHHLSFELEGDAVKISEKIE